MREPLEAEPSCSLRVVTVYAGVASSILHYHVGTNFSPLLPHCIIRSSRLLLAVVGLFQLYLQQQSLARTQLVLMPSPADVNAQPTFPQWPMQAEELRSFADPAIHSVR